MDPTAQKHLSRMWFYIAVALLVASVWAVQVYAYHKIFNTEGTIFSGSSGPPPAPTEWQKMAAEAMATTNGLLTTLGTALLGALGLLIGNKAADGSRVRHMWAAFLAAVGAGLSLYFGYVSHLNLLAMISSETINPYDPVYMFSSHAQFYTLLAGAFLFADFAFHGLSKETT